MIRTKALIKNVVEGKSPANVLSEAEPLKPDVDRKVKLLQELAKIGALASAASGYARAVSSEIKGSEKGELFKIHQALRDVMTAISTLGRNVNKEGFGLLNRDGDQLADELAKIADKKKFASSSNVRKVVKKGD